MTDTRLKWVNLGTVPSKQYECGYCGNDISSNYGYRTERDTPAIYICHHCRQPTYFDDIGKQYPGAAFGKPVADLPSEQVRVLYKEARDCLKVDACTASVMCCRKLLMNIAVAEGAEEGKTFKEYIKYLETQGFLTGKTKHWVKYIKDKGNEANHQIKVMERNDAELLITFVEAFLKHNYEFPARLKPPEE